MKKIIFLITLAFFASVTVFGQRFAYIDSEYILENIPEYQAAQMELNQLSVQWQNEIEEKFAAIERMYREYQTESVLLPEEIRIQREEEIIEKERQAKQLQMQRFGREGDLFKKGRNWSGPFRIKFSMPWKKLPPAVIMPSFSINMAAET